jgi:putative holliday junction resolvase
MKYLGIDYGTKKVGIAVSDEDASFAFPKEIVATEKLFEYLKDFVIKEQIKAIVMGESLASNGEENKINESAHAFGRKIQKEINIPVFFVREDFSSVEAHRYQTKKGNRDDSAAAVILQRFLDKNRN